MREILVSPVKRWQISLGQILSATLVSVLQGILIMILASFLGLRIDFLHGAAMVVVMVLFGMTFSSIGLFLATMAKSSSTFQIMISVIVMPLTFLSGAYIPIPLIPAFLRPVIYLNPLTYTTSVFRYVAMHLENATEQALVTSGIAFNINGFMVTPPVALCIMVAMGALFFLLCVRKFNRADFSSVKVAKFGHRR
jgi:ABC-2 type transport system permease protein